MMLPTYIRAYKDAVKGILALDTETSGDPDAQQALADVCRAYVRAVTDHHDPCADLHLAYIYVLEHTLDDTEARLRNAEALIDEQLHDESEEEDVPTPAPVLEEAIAKTKAEIEAAISDLTPDEAEAEPPSVLVCTGPLGVREDDPEPSKPRKRIDLILEYVREHPGLTKAEIAEAIGCPHTAVYYPITKLVNQGILRTVIGSKDGRIRYYVKEADEPARKPTQEDVPKFIDTVLAAVLDGDRDLTLEQIAERVDQDKGTVESALEYLVSNRSIARTGDKYHGFRVMMA